jgi:serine/threonine-protein kinase
VKAPAAAKKPGEATKLAGGRAVPPATARPTSAARRQTEASDKGSKAPSATRTNVTEISRRRKKTNTNTTTRTGINKINLEEERSKARFPLLLAGLCVIVGAIYVKKPSLLGLEKKPEAVTKTADNSPASKLDKDGIKDREPSSSEKGISDIVSTERILLLGLDKLNHKVFIDGKSVQPDYLRMVEAPVGKEFYLRVQMPGQKHFVRKMKLNEGEEKRIQLESEGEASYGFLEMSRACIQGQLYFELFGEKRVEVLPIEGDKGIIPFPVDVDDNGDSLDKTYKAYYRIKGDSGNIEREIEFDISEGKMTDLCDSENID